LTRESEPTSYRTPLSRSARPIYPTPEIKFPSNNSPDYERDMLKRIILTMMAGLTGSCLPAQEPPVLGVAMDDFPPMSSKAGGFDLDLISAIANKQGWELDVIWKDNVQECLQAVQDGEAHLAISGISITSAREKQNDFSHAYFQSGIQVLVPAESGIVSMRNLREAWPTFRNAMGVLLCILLVFGHLIWLVERNNEHEEHFSRGYFRGVGQGIWWTLVTSSTVGYGDIVPKLGRGRALAGVVIIVGIAWFGLFISSMTSAFSSLVVDARITDVRDFTGKTAATKSGSTSEQYLNDLVDVNVLACDNIDEAYQALLAGDADAVVFDAPALMRIAQRDQRVRMGGRFFEEQEYGIALPEDSPHLEMINQALLELKEDGTYARIYAKWFD
jgi:polar amino acid transport system substrate-binding protein